MWRGISARRSWKSLSKVFCRRKANSIKVFNVFKNKVESCSGIQDNQYLIVDSFHPTVMLRNSDNGYAFACIKFQ